MNTHTLLIGLAVVIVLGGGVYLLTENNGEEKMMENDEAMMEDDSSMMEEEGAMMDLGDDMIDGVGTYEAYAPEKLARAEEGDVVLFFRASWCPTCRALDADIKAHQGNIPDGVTILDVDYDDSTALKQKYGVTYQHTLVQVDAEGNMITKWSSSPTLDSLVAQIQ